MEAYMLFSRSKERMMIRCDEQEEDIGCPSDSELSLSSSSTDGVELADDASSSSSSAGHFEMSLLMTQLPIKRGLSKFFDGKSQSFASLAAMGGLEDLAKPMRKRLKTSRSCGAAVGLQDAHRRRLSPRPLCRNGSAAATSFKRASVLGGASSRRTTTRPVAAVSPRPEGVLLPGQALLFA